MFFRRSIPHLNSAEELTSCKFFEVWGKCESHNILRGCKSSVVCESFCAPNARPLFKRVITDKVFAIRGKGERTRPLGVLSEGEG